MQIPGALCQFGHLANAPADGQPGHRMTPQIFHQPTGKISHVQHRCIGQTMQRLHRTFGGGTCATSHMWRPARPRHINAAVNRGNPGGARKRTHDPRRAEHRKTINDAEPWVPGFQSQSPAPWNSNGDVDIGRLAVAECQVLDLSLHHLSRNRIDRRLAHSDRQSSFCDRTDALARMKAHPPRGARHLCDNQSAMGDVRVITGVFGDANFNPIARHLAIRDFEDWRLTFWKGDLHLGQLLAAP